MRRLDEIKREADRIEFLTTVPQVRLLAIDAVGLVALVERMRDALRLVEFAGENGGGHPACPTCGRSQKLGHRDDCELSAALAAADGTDTQTARDDGQGGT